MSDQRNIIKPGSSSAGATGRKGDRGRKMTLQESLDASSPENLKIPKKRDLKDQRKQRADTTLTASDQSSIKQI